MLLYLFIVKSILQNLKNFQRNGNIYKFLLLKVEQSCNNLFSTFIASYFFFFFFLRHGKRTRCPLLSIIDTRTLQYYGQITKFLLCKNNISSWKSIRANFFSLNQTSNTPRSFIDCNPCEEKRR